MILTKLTYSPQEAADALSVCRATIYNLISRGELRFIKLGRNTRITADELARLLNEGTGVAKSAPIAADIDAKLTVGPVAAALLLDTDADGLASMLADGTLATNAEGRIAIADLREVAS